MNDVPILLALTAGMVAALNPCGFALLPAYLTLVVAGGDEGSSRSAAVGRALTMSASMTAGFVAVFGAFGLVAVPLALSLERYLPWATIVIGFALVGLGVYLLTGRELLINTPKMAGAAPGKTVRSMFLYGVAYAVASLSCTIGPFLAITTSTFRSENVLSGLSVFVLYGIGMGLTFAPVNAAALLEVPPSEYGQANAGFSTVRFLASALGIAAVIAAIGEGDDAFAGYDRAFAVLAVVSAAAVVLVATAWPRHRVAQAG